MCGICGILNFDRNRFVDKGDLIAMRDLMVHRGPDDAGIYMNKNIEFFEKKIFFSCFGPFQPKLIDHFIEHIN